MRTQDLYTLFTIELDDIYNAEHQIIEALPRMIRLASDSDLKEALTKHLLETEDQVVRIEKVFSRLDLPPAQKRCRAMEGLIREADELIRNQSKSAVLDAAIIAAMQKIEHYEIASYGTLRSFAKHLDLSGEIIDLIQDNLDEEGAADKKLTKIAIGGFFTDGINKEAAETELVPAQKSR